MKKSMILISNSNLFTVFSLSFLSKEYDCHLLNVRYSNEDFSKDEHFLNQLKEVLDEQYSRRGLKNGLHDFEFSDRLAFRLDRMICEKKPDAIFYEMKTFKGAEWSLLKHIAETYNLPIVGFIGQIEQPDKIISCLSRMGVREVITKLDAEIFENAAKRSLKTRL